MQDSNYSINIHMNHMSSESVHQQHIMQCFVFFFYCVYLLNYMKETVITENLFKIIFLFVLMHSAQNQNSKKVLGYQWLMQWFHILYSFFSSRIDRLCSNPTICSNCPALLYFCKTFCRSSFCCCHKTSKVLFRLTTGEKWEFLFGGGQNCCRLQTAALPLLLTVFGYFPTVTISLQWQKLSCNTIAPQPDLAILM